MKNTKISLVAVLIATLFTVSLLNVVNVKANEKTIVNLVISEKDIVILSANEKIFNVVISMKPSSGNSMQGLQANFNIVFNTISINSDTAVEPPDTSVEHHSKKAKL